MAVRKILNKQKTKSIIKDKGGRAKTLSTLDRKIKKVRNNRLNQVPKVSAYGDQNIVITV